MEVARTLLFYYMTNLYPFFCKIHELPSIGYAMYVGNVLVLDNLSVLRFHYDTRCHLSVGISRNLQLEKGTVLLFSQLRVNGSGPI